MIFLTAIGPIPPSPFPPVSPRPFPPGFQKGVAYETWYPGDFSSANSDRTLSQLIAPLGVNWLALIVKCVQADRTSTQIVCDPTGITPSDDDITHVVKVARKLGMRIMLKPHLDLLDPRVGRQQINFGPDSAAWQVWFAEYTRVITHYAALAERLGVEYFVVGTELTGTIGEAGRWRDLIRQVRQVYTGPLTYAALNYIEDERITWWDALDAIGIDAYYPLTLTTQPTLTQLKIGWIPGVLQLEALSRRWNRPIIFTEIGYMSADGTNQVSGFWWLDSPVDVQEQADCYQAALETFQDKPWLQGMFWWSWSVFPDQGGPSDKSYSIHNKPAEEVLRRFYRADLPPFDAASSARPVSLSK